MAPRTQTNGINSSPSAAYIGKQEDRVVEGIETPAEMFTANLAVMAEAKKAGVEGSLQYAMHIAIAMVRSNLLNTTQKKQLVAQIHSIAKTINAQSPFESIAGFGLPNGNGTGPTHTVQ